MQQAPQNPSSIISLASRCSKPPDPDPNLVSSTTDEEVDLKQWIAEFREQLRIDRTKILDELRQDFSLLKKILSILQDFTLTNQICF